MKKQISKKNKIIILMLLCTSLFAFTGLTIGSWFLYYNVLIIKQLSLLNTTFKIDVENQKLNNVQLKQSEFIFLKSYFLDSNPNLYYEFFNSLNLNQTWNQYYAENKLQDLARVNQNFSNILKNYETENNLFKQQITMEMKLNYNLKANEFLFFIFLVFLIINLVLIIVFGVLIKNKKKLN